MGGGGTRLFCGGFFSPIFVLSKKENSKGGKTLGTGPGTQNKSRGQPPRTADGKSPLPTVNRGGGGKEMGRKKLNHFMPGRNETKGCQPEIIEKRGSILNIAEEEEKR